MKKLRSMPYEDFLKTKYWDRVRKMKIKQSGCKCQVCGKKDTELHVHHNSYEHHGDEANHLEDLVVLCKNCHNLFHKTSHLKH
jgi:5-methylcytosine-specific restriction endonuclease McrA